jgi:hypothetical protein
MDKMWIYGLGYILVMYGYTDLMRYSKQYGATSGLHTIVELLGGAGSIIFFIWGFFVFKWWVPLAMPLVWALPVTFLNIKVIKNPMLFVLVGTGLSLYSLL